MNMSKRVSVVTVADVSDDIDLETEVWHIKLNFCFEFEHKVWSRV